MSVTNHGAIVYVDDNGEEHSFSGFSDLENYIIQNYDVTVVDYDKLDFPSGCGHFDITKM